jgi:nitrogen fixation protein NifB
MYRYGEEKVNSDLHPCFTASAHGKWGRIHLPVAPDCNISCAYCSRKTDCVNESRPGVCSRILDPEEAAHTVDEAVRKMPSLAVAGVAGPGDPLANRELTLRTFELVRRNHPDLLLCLSTNGVALADCAPDLKALSIGHVTITLNAASLSTAARIYQSLHLNGRSLRGLEAAEIILERQNMALAALERLSITVKVNTVVIPGVNDGEVENIARHASRFGVALMNCIGLIPASGSLMSDMPAPTAERMEELRARAGAYVPQMRHCARCRADAFGLLARDRGLDSLIRGKVG